MNTAQNDDDFSDLFAQPLSGQAARVIARFGGVPKLAAALEFVGHPISRFSIYKWTYPRALSGHGGTGGIIPAASVPWVRRAAKELGIMLTNGDWAL